MGYWGLIGQTIVEKFLGHGLKNFFGTIVEELSWGQTIVEEFFVTREKQL